MPTPARTSPIASALNEINASAARIYFATENPIQSSNATPKILITMTIQSEGDLTLFNWPESLSGNSNSFPFFMIVLPLSSTNFIEG